MIETHPFTTESDWLRLRVRDVTSTESAALFDASPYLTRFELWHHKREEAITPFEVTERMRWGTRLQDTIAHGVAEDRGWKIRRMDEYMCDPETRMGASFDFLIEGLVEAGPFSSHLCKLLEIKNVDALQFREKWIVDGDYIEAPPHIEIQCQHQLAVCGLEKIYIAALVGGNKVHVIERLRDERMIAAIRARVAKFWRTIDAGEEPSPDWERDAAAVIGMLDYAEPGKVITAGPEVLALVEEYNEFAADEEQALVEKKKRKAQIFLLIGDAEKVLLDGVVGNSISAGLVGPAHVEYDRAGYRAFKVNRKREKKNS